MTDVTAERAVLAAIYRYGAEAFYDVSEVVGTDSFTNESNSIIFRCLENIIRKDDSVKIDIPSVFSSAQELGVQSFFLNKAEVEHLKAVANFPVLLENARRFGIKLAKLELIRDCYREVDNIKNKLANLTGSESAHEILGVVEEAALSLSQSLDAQDDEPQLMFGDIEEVIEHLENNPIDQIGISTGYPKYDFSIGGGLRNGTVNVVGARPKVGKSLFTSNVCQHISMRVGVPVLYLDTEMTKTDQQYRNMGIASEVHISDIETGQYSEIKAKRDKIRELIKKKNIPFYYKNIGGKSFSEQQAIIRRWIMKKVGLNENNQANSCVVLYDYLKLTNDKQLENVQEYQALGFLMTELHNLTVRYNFPMLALMQLNRDGIGKESTSTASGSDRIVWLCSNYTIFKPKSDEEVANDGPEAGNRKLVPIVARHGAGLDSGDYINMNLQGWCGKLTEGQTHYEIMSNKKDNEYDSFTIQNEEEIPARI